MPFPFTAIRSWEAGPIEHWFDRTTKFLASGAVPRRSLLERAVLAGASTLAAKTTAFAASNGEVAQRIPPILPVPRTVAPCTLQYTAAGTTTTTFSAQSAYQGKPLVLHGVQTTTGHHDRSVSVHIEVTHGGALLFELVHSALQGRGPNHRRVLASRGAVTYGAAVRGVHWPPRRSRGRRASRPGDHRTATPPPPRRLHLRRRVSGRVMRRRRLRFPLSTVHGSASRTARVSSGSSSPGSRRAGSAGSCSSRSRHGKRRSRFRL